MGKIDISSNSSVDINTNYKNSYVNNSFNPYYIVDINTNAETSIDVDIYENVSNISCMDNINEQESNNRNNTSDNWSNRLSRLDKNTLDKIDSNKVDEFSMKIKDKLDRANNYNLSKTDIKVGVGLIKPIKIR